MLDILYRIKRIDLKEELNLQLTSVGVELPRLKKKQFSVHQSRPFEKPTKVEVVEAIHHAKLKAIADVKNLNLSVGGIFDTCFKGKPTEKKKTTKDPRNTDRDGLDPWQDTDDDSKETFRQDSLDNNGDSENSNSSITPESDYQVLKSVQGPLNLKHFGKVNKNEELDPRSKFVAIKPHEDEHPAVKIKKSTLVWLLRKKTNRVSTDRLYRYKTI